MLRIALPLELDKGSAVKLLIIGQSRLFWRLTVNLCIGESP